ncbi:MAG: GNAT family N-acetyltransferase [Chloroflexi bacterium]|nr:GNAT family N-acetyltransferase [Chloroflexota bacterium]
MDRPPELRTDRLLLRPFHGDDVDDVFSYASDPEWGRHLPVPRPYTRSDAEEFVAGVAVSGPRKRLEWAIVHQGRVSGGIELRFHDHDSAEIGYSLARTLWGRGLTTEAASAVVGYGFEALELVRIWAAADVRNVASWRVMEKLGMRREGLLRRRRVVHGERVDDVLYALLREEWAGAD